MASKAWRRKIPFAYCPLPLSYIDTWMPHISLQAHQVFTILMRKTWGFNKETDVLAIAEIVRMGSLSRSGVDRALRELRTCGLIRCDGPVKHPKTITVVLSRLLHKRGSVRGDVTEQSVASDTVLR